MKICGEFVQDMLHAVTNTHLMHFQTRSFSEHMALGAYYEGLSDLVDQFAEAVQGKYGLLEGYDSDYRFPTMKPAEYLGQVSKYIAQTRKQMPQDSELQNLVDEIAALTDTTIYKLRFLG